MIELDIWFTQFGVRMQKLCKLQVSNSCCAEAAGRPDTFAKNIIPCHKTTRDPPMDPYALNIQANTKVMTERPSTWIKGPICSTCRDPLAWSTTMDFMHPLIKMSVKRRAEKCQLQASQPTNFSIEAKQPTLTLGGDQERPREGRQQMA